MRPDRTSEGFEPAEDAAESTVIDLYRDHGEAVLAYALRRLPEPEDAADVLAETFLAVWRRVEEARSVTEPRLWLYGLARGAIANQRRGQVRRTRLAERIIDSIARDPVRQEADEREAAGPVLGALAELPEADRELLLLIGWEGLTPAQAARTLGVTSLAARSRLHRARRRLRHALADAEAGPRRDQFDPKEA
jgi:RNA polymerase sigma-70 factor (ECF subfamily)